VGTAFRPVYVHIWMHIKTELLDQNITLPQVLENNFHYLLHDILHYK